MISCRITIKCTITQLSDLGEWAHSSSVPVLIVAHLIGTRERRYVGSRRITTWPASPFDSEESTYFLVIREIDYTMVKLRAPNVMRGWGNLTTTKSGYGLRNDN